MIGHNLANSLCRLGSIVITLVSPSSMASRFWFPFNSFCLEQQLHSNFKEGYSIIKYKSHLNKDVIHKLLTNLQPFFDLDWLNSSLQSVTLAGMQQFHSKFTEG